MTTRIYDANRVQVSFANIILKGYADGEFLRITVPTQYRSVLSVDGNVSRAKSVDRRATLELDLMSTSPSNDLLSAIHRGDMFAEGGAGVGSFMVVDLSGASLYHAGAAWISRTPEVTYGREASTRTWQFDCRQLYTFTGGNL